MQLSVWKHYIQFTLKYVYTFYQKYAKVYFFFTRVLKKLVINHSLNESSESTESTASLTDSVSLFSEGFIRMIQTGSSRVCESFWMIH